MEMNEKDLEKDLIEQVTKLVIQELKKYELNNKNNDEKNNATQSRNVGEVVIGVGPAFLNSINFTINGLSHVDVLNELKAGIEEEGLLYRVVKVYKTSDVAFIGKEAAQISGSGIGIGLQSKGTAIIHQRDLYPLSNLELFPQAPLLTLEHYRKIGQNAAKYVKGEVVTPIAVVNDPMVRSSYQVKAALMHIKETELVDKNIATTTITVEWGDSFVSTR